MRIKSFSGSLKAFETAPMDSYQISVFRSQISHRRSKRQRCCTEHKHTKRFFFQKIRGFCYCLFPFLFHFHFLNHTALCFFIKIEVGFVFLWCGNRITLKNNFSKFNIRIHKILLVLVYFLPVFVGVGRMDGISFFLF